MVALGKGLNLELVAEGVETHQQVIVLQKLGCEIMQGYFFSKPLTVEAFTQLLQK
jgi:EAL domain-containing protein (putative c-di-GMP-specific phosphodiesterase class I)